MKTIGVIANCTKPQTLSALKRLAVKAKELGAHLISCDDVPDSLDAVERVSRVEMIGRIDLLAALGGDGTVLRAVRTISGSDCPILGVNVGSLGFMTSVPANELEEALQTVAEDNYSISIRSMMLCTIKRNGETLETYEVLNDVAIGWGQSSRVVTLDVRINWEEVTSFVCDGLILSTPTGSTGHSLSAGGPILHPEVSDFVLSIICPHTLSNRPLVISDSSEITIDIKRSQKELLLSADGQGHFALQEGDQIHIEKSMNVARLVRLPGHSYFALLRHKLHWRGSNV